MKNCTSHQTKNGFTLIEMLVSLALFTIVSTVTVGALLSLIGGNQRLLTQQTLTSSAIFSLDNMTREIRTGSYYNCRPASWFTDMSYNQNTLGTTPRDCPGTTGVSFVESSTRTSSGGRVAYYFATDTGIPGNPITLWRRIGNESPSKLLPDDIVLTSDSRFIVGGSAPLNSAITTPIGYNRQPQVTVIMVLAETADTRAQILQTTITQRSLDL